MNPTVATRTPERLYDRNFLIAIISQTCFVSANTLMAHYARWIEFLGGNLQQVGFIMGFCLLVGLCLRPWMAQWINRWGARTMLAIGYCLFAGSSLGNLLLQDLGPMIYLVRSCLVLGTAVIFTSGLTYITQTTPSNRRTEAIGIYGVGGFMGMMLGPLVGDLFLHDRSAQQFQHLFIAAALANLVPLIGLMFLRPSGGGGKAISLKLSEFIAKTRDHWPGAILGIDFAFGVCITGPFVFLASYIDEANLSLPGISVIGLFFWCYAGVAIALRLCFRRLPDRIGNRKVLMAGVACMSVGMTCFALVSQANPWLIVVPAMMTGAGHSLMFHTMTSLTLESFPSPVRGTGSALALMMLDLGTIVGAPILGSIGEQYGFNVLFGSTGGFCLVTGALYALVHRHHQPVNASLAGEPPDR